MFRFQVYRESTLGKREGQQRGQKAPIADLKSSIPSGLGADTVEEDIGPRKSLFVRTKLAERSAARLAKERKQSRPPERGLSQRQKPGPSALNNAENGPAGQPIRTASEKTAGSQQLSSLKRRGFHPEKASEFTAAARSHRLAVGKVRGAALDQPSQAAPFRSQQQLSAEAGQTSTLQGENATSSEGDSAQLRGDLDIPIPIR